jgi:hypothetical protein
MTDETLALLTARAIDLVLGFFERPRLGERHFATSSLVWFGCVFGSGGPSAPAPLRAAAGAEGSRSVSVLRPAGVCGAGVPRENRLADVVSAGFPEAIVVMWSFLPCHGHVAAMAPR